MNNYHAKAFNELLLKLASGEWGVKLDAKSLAMRSGVSERQISQFRNGKLEISFITVLQILNEIPPEARAWYLGEVCGAVPRTNIRNYLASLDNEELANHILLISEIMRERSKTQHPKQELAVLHL